jgi:D-alanine transaminase
MSTAYLNGVFLPLEEAKISPLDRGFLFGDGVYEVIPVYNGKCFGLENHYRRLEQSLKGIEIDNPLDYDQWRSIFTQLIAANGDRQAIYLQITRGVQERRGHAFTDGKIHPTIFAMSMEFKQPNHTGLKAILAEDNRWFDCYIKSINLLPNVLQLRRAHAQDVDEVILLRDGLVTEAASSNVFIVKDNCVQTPPDNANILPGITKQFILNLAYKNDILAREAPISEIALMEADEVWLTSSTKEITPVIKINDQAVGLGKPGPVWQTMQDLYAANTPK